ncbi:hypothetical protein [Bacillus pinisoli]|uniref:hypothetical protein n=1 Tax=Bacillus pinisoli TaxID=2901866 RepID=UPI001FF6972B|nr:hypothetical protein [Bacillus pinisoli]
MKRKAVIQQLQQLLPSSKPHCYLPFIPEFAIIVYLANGMPFSPLVRMKDKCAPTKLLKLLQVDCEKNCLFVRPIPEQNPSFISKECITIDFNQVCALQIVEIKKFIKEEDYEEESSSSSEELDKEENSQERKKRPIYFPSYPIVSTNGENHNSKEEPKENEPCDGPTNLNSIDSKEATEQLKSCYNSNQQQYAHLEVEVEQNNQDNCSQEESKVLKEVKKYNKKKKVKKFNHWIVPFSSIINIEVDEDDNC